MKLSSPTPFRLSDSFHHQLNLYALAASAAGVGVLALAPSSEGKIVYTPAHKVLGPNSGYGLDLNHDGKTDFTLRDVRLAGTGTTVEGFLSAIPAAGNGVEGTHSRQSGQAYALKRGAVVGRRRSFRAEGMVEIRIEDSTNYSYGSWLNVSNRYLGLKFKVEGKVHYGWARLSVVVDRRAHITATLTGYAYETIPNKSVITGKTKGTDAINTSGPAGLGRLAQGASRLTAWRPGR